MKKRPITLGTFLLWFGLAAMLVLSSCASFKMVSQRPAAGYGAGVDTTAAATSAEGASQADATSPAQKAKEPDVDAVAAATSE